MSPPSRMQDTPSFRVGFDYCEVLYLRPNYLVRRKPSCYFVRVLAATHHAEFREITVLSNLLPLWFVHRKLIRVSCKPQNTDAIHVHSIRSATCSS